MLRMLAPYVLYIRNLKIYKFTSILSVSLPAVRPGSTRVTTPSFSSQQR